MKHKNLYKACVFLAVIGLTLVYFSSLYMELEKVDIAEIDRSWTGKNVKISGNVTSYSTSGSAAFINVNDSTGGILAVNFDSKKKLQEGDRVNITGHADLYRGTLEVIVKEISGYR